MKAKTFENLIRKIVREEIDYALRREIKTLKEDLRDELKPTIVEQTKSLVEVPNTPQQPMSESTKASLRKKIMGSNPIPKTPIKNQSFTPNENLNALLNETAQGDTNTESTMAPVNSPFSTSEVIPTEALPESVANVVNRDYSDLMKAIAKKKGR
jgi:hypothetical protein